LEELHTADLAQASLELDVRFKVDDPVAVTQINAPLQLLSRMVESAACLVIKSLPHQSLFGDADAGQLANKVALERQIRLSLLAEPALEGLRILSVRIVRIEGDPLYLQLRRAERERELLLFQAKTERLSTSARKEIELDDARREAEIFELESSRREFERLMEETRLAHERAMAKIKALGQTATVLADPRYLVVVNAIYAQPGYTNGRDQVLDRVIGSLIQSEPTATSGGVNGHSRR